MTQRLDGDKVRRTRERAGLMLKDLAARAELDKSHLSKIERGKRTGTPPQHLRIAYALGVELDDLVAAEVTV